MKGKRVAELAEKRRLWQKHLSRWESSGLGQGEYCRQNNLRTNIFLYWKKKLLTKSSSAALVEIPTVILSGSASAQKSMLCLVVGGRYRIEIPQGFDVHTLDRLIHFLDRR
jgi:hypothetical protein